MPDSIHAGDLLAGRYRLDDLLTESAGGRFWLAHDQVLHRPVAVHLIPRDDERAEGLMAAARRTAPYHDRRLLRVLDADDADGCSYVVNEWGQGTSLDIMLPISGPLRPRRAAWVASEIADSLARAHDAGLDHGRMVPENVLIDLNGQVRIIGFAVDAALHGLRPGRQSADLIDTVAILYAALTGRWAGVSSSKVTAAPTDHGQVLRPRQVRAGIPRLLDDLCDQVINSTGSPARSAIDVTTMAGVSEVLSDFVGDPSGMASAESWLEHHPVHLAPSAWAAIDSSPPAEAPAAASAPAPAPPPGPAPAPPPVGPTVASAPVDAEKTVVARAADETQHERDARPEPAADAAQQPDRPPGPPAGPGPPATEMPTQAGIPVFDENNDVGWVQARSTAPPPPPPLEEKQAKPLFAPEPADGGPVRRARPGATPAPPRDYWPWETGTGMGTGIGARLGPEPQHESYDRGGEVVPGRRWFRLAMSLAVIALLLVAGVAAYQLNASSGEDPDGPTPTAAPGVSTPTPFTGLSAVDFDPQGAEPREENPDLVPLALDADPATSWATVTYQQDFGPTGLKDGVGLQLDLGSTVAVREVEIATLGGPTSLSVYVTGPAPAGVAKLTPVGTASGNGVLTVALDEAVSGRFVTVWLTSIPPIEGEFRGAIAEIVVKG